MTQNYLLIPCGSCKKVHIIFAKIGQDRVLYIPCPVQKKQTSCLQEGIGSRLKTLRFPCTAVALLQAKCLMAKRLMDKRLMKCDKIKAVNDALSSNYTYFFKPLDVGATESIRGRVFQFLNVN